LTVEESKLDSLDWRKNYFLAFAEKVQKVGNAEVDAEIGRTLVVYLKYEPLPERRL